MDTKNSVHVAPTVFVVMVPLLLVSITLLAMGIGICFGGKAILACLFRMDGKSTFEPGLHDAAHVKFAAIVLLASNPVSLALFWEEYIFAFCMIHCCCFTGLLFLLMLVLWMAASAVCVKICSCIYVGVMKFKVRRACISCRQNPSRVPKVIFLSGLELWIMAQRHVHASVEQMHRDYPDMICWCWFFKLVRVFLLRTVC